ncbi:peptidoglycan-binding protein [bacterium]|nr:peptidoglycan-binding protein [bacterium]
MISGVSNQVRSYQALRSQPQAAQAPQVKSTMAADSVAVRLPQAPVQAGGGSFDAASLMDGIKKMFKSISSFFVGLWDRITGKKPVDNAGPIDENTRALAEQYKLQPTKENVDAFLAEVQGYASPGPNGFQTLGPGNPNAEAITQIQQLMKSWGYSVEPTGQYDSATQAAVRSFKQSNGLHQTYKGTDGNFAVNEYLDYQTYQKMEAIVKSGGTPSTQPPATTQPPAENGTLNWQAIASQYKLYASQDNVNAFLAEVKTYQIADANGFRALGPGYPNQDEIKEVQGALAQVGFPIQASGTWDAATAKAVMDFKAKYGLHQNYRSSDGNWAINEYADQSMLQKLASLLA